MFVQIFSHIHTSEFLNTATIYILHDIQQDFPLPSPDSHDFPGLENANFTFSDLPESVLTLVST